MIDKEQEKKDQKKDIIFLVTIAVLSVLLIGIIAESLFNLKMKRTKENDKDPKNAPAAARKYINDTNIDENGNIILGKSIAEWWEELKNSGNTITEYLDSPEELAKLMNAVMALEYPDTRENPDEPIDWDKIDVNSKEIQGIVKFKRALKDGGDPISMTYVSPSKFQELISNYNNANNDDERKKALDEVLKHFTMEKTSSSSNNLSTGGSPIVEETLKYACSWVGKISYELSAGGKLVDGGKSDCSHFIHRVFGHVGLMEDTLEYFDKYGHSLQWGYGGDNGGVPGTVKIGTDLSQASPGDVIWWHFGSGSNNHVAIYLGNGKIVECAAGRGGVVISNIKNGEGYDEILHFSQLPTDPTGYFDPETMTLHSSISGSDSGNIAKVPSLQGMVFIGDSIMYCLAEKDNTLKEEGAKYLYRGGSDAKYFLGKNTASGSTNNCIENNGYFNWDANFKDITNPTGFYLVLGQNFSDIDDGIQQMDELIKKIRSKYSTPPIFINSVLNTTEKGSEEFATKLNERLKVYCASQNNVYYSDILRGFKERITELADYEDGYYDHPNPQGSKLLVKNIKENIVGTSSTTSTAQGTGTTTTTTTSTVTSTAPANSTSGEMIVQEAEKYVGKLPYVYGGQSLETGADCSGFVWAILNKLGLINWGRTNDKGIRNKGTEVKSLSEAQAGDVICYNGHVAFYDGKGGIIHESNPKDGCKHSNNAAYMSIITIRRFVASTSTDSSTGSVVAPRDDFSTETRQIVMSHINDFNEHTYKDFINNYPGGYDGYMQSLGGVFAKYGGKGKKIEIKNAGDLQEAAEFVWGLMSIWGFDEWNGNYHAWGKDEEFEGLYKSAYYTSHTYTGGGYSEGNINDICSDPSKAMRTNCNAGIDTFLWSTNLNDGKSIATQEHGGERIDRKEDLRVGDLVHFFHNSDETGWGHVAIVGEIDSSTGDVILYDTGNRFIRTGRYKIPLNIEKGGSYDNYVKWVGRRHFNIDQSTNRSSSSSSSTATQNTSTYKVKVATWNESEDIMDAEDPAVVDYHRHTYNITTTTIPYQEIVSKYKMPFNYLWTMLVYSQDKNYVFDLAKLVDNSKIEITIHDNYTKTTNIVKNTYTNYKKIYTTANANISYNYLDYSAVPPNVPVLPPERSDSITASVDATTKHEPTYTNTHTSIYKNNTLDIALTLADSWFVKYAKQYTYNKPTTSSNNNTVKLDDIVDEPENVPGDFGGHKDELTRKAEAKVRSDAYNISVSFTDVNTEYTTKVINRSTYTENIVESSSYVSSVPGGSGGGISYGMSTANVKTGSLNENNYVDLPSPKSDGDANNTLQGFCLVDDDMMAYVINHNERCTLYLVDINTMQEYDSMSGFYDHGNTIAYDPVNRDILFPEPGSIKLVKVNKTTKKFENKRSISAMKQARDPSQIAYNATHDLFIVNNYVYTRQAFYSGGNPIKSLEYTMLEGNDLYAGSTSYGNHVYFYFADDYGHSKNYFAVCDLNTGSQVELIHDNLAREGEEASFSSDGTLYLFHGEAGSPFQKTDYNYFYDTNIDKSNVTPGASGSKEYNDIARYNTGGEYTETASFEKVFNSHYNARSNILSVTERLFKALEQNSDTEKMADLTRYLLHKATGNDYGDYGDKQFNYEEYDPGEFNQIGAGGLEGNTTEERVWLALINAGFNDVAAAGIMGNLSYESGGSGSKIIKTDTVEGGYNENNGGIGMCQWTNGNRGTEGRNTQLRKYAQSKGTTWKDEKAQIEFLITELTGEGSAKGYAHLQFMKKTYDGVTYPIDAVKTVENDQNKLEYATKAFAATFERPAASAFTNSMSRRLDLAKYFYSQYNGKRASSAGTFGPSSAYANKSPEEKVKYLFPGGKPTTKAEAESYLTTINVPITKKDGTKTTCGVRVHKAIAQDVYNACIAAQNSGFKIYSIGGYRQFGTDSAGKSGGLSFSQHCYGLAVDINPTENGQFKGGKPTGNWFYSPGQNEYSIQSDSVLVRTFKSMGWGWGGEWHSSKDYMHFSFMGT